QDHPPQGTTERLRSGTIPPRTFLGRNGVRLLEASKGPSGPLLVKRSSRRPPATSRSPSWGARCAWSSPAHAAPARAPAPPAGEGAGRAAPGRGPPPGPPRAAAGRG